MTRWHTNRFRIIHFNVGAPGIRSDGGVFKEDRLGQMIHDGTINLPDPAPLPKDPEVGSWTLRGYVK